MHRRGFCRRVIQEVCFRGAEISPSRAETIKIIGSANTTSGSPTGTRSATLRSKSCPGGGLRLYTNARRVWLLVPHEGAGPPCDSTSVKEETMKKYLAEAVGTFILVLFGCGTAVVAGDKVGLVGISFAFGLALIGAAYGIGPVSGCHINPAVSLGVWAAGRMRLNDMLGYWAAQFAGAILAA